MANSDDEKSADGWGYPPQGVRIYLPQYEEAILNGNLTDHQLRAWTNHVFLTLLEDNFDMDVSTLVSVSQAFGVWVYSGEGSEPGDRNVLLFRVAKICGRLTASTRYIGMTRAEFKSYWFRMNQTLSEEERVNFFIGVMIPARPKGKKDAANYAWWNNYRTEYKERFGRVSTAAYSRQTGASGGGGGSSRRSVASGGGGGSSRRSVAGGDSMRRADASTSLVNLARGPSSVNRQASSSQEDGLRELLEAASFGSVRRQRTDTDVNDLRERILELLFQFQMTDFPLTDEITFRRNYVRPVEESMAKHKTESDVLRTARDVIKRVNEMYSAIYGFKAHAQVVLRGSVPSANRMDTRVWMLMRGLVESILVTGGNEEVDLQNEYIQPLQRLLARYNREEATQSQVFMIVDPLMTELALLEYAIERFRVYSVNKLSEMEGLPRARNGGGGGKPKSTPTFAKKVPERTFAVPEGTFAVPERTFTRDVELHRLMTRLAYAIVENFPDEGGLGDFEARYVTPLEQFVETYNPRQIMRMEIISSVETLVGGVHTYTRTKGREDRKKILEKLKAFAMTLVKVGGNVPVLDDELSDSSDIYIEPGEDENDVRERMAQEERERKAKKAREERERKARKAHEERERRASAMRDRESRAMALEDRLSYKVRQREQIEIERAKARLERKFS